MNKKNKNYQKILIHDYFENFGGGERLINILSKKFDFLYYGFEVNNIFKKYFSRIKNEKLVKHNMPIFFKKIFMIIKFFFLRLPQSSILLCSGNYSIFVNSKNVKKKAVYIHSLPKLFFEHEIFYHKKKYYLIFLLLKKIFQKYYIKKLKEFDLIIANSRFTKNKLIKLINKKVDIIYPPIKKINKKIFFKGFYLSNSRHEPEKNIDKIILAFKMMPDKKLIITSSGSLTKKLKRLSKYNHNIKFTGLVSDKTYFNLLINANALINISKSEDFGMGAVEGMMHGKVNFFLKDGGYLETCFDKFNAVKINEKNIVNDLVKKIQFYDIKKLKSLKKNCIIFSQKFNENFFLNEISKKLNI